MVLSRGPFGHISTSGWEWGIGRGAGSKVGLRVMVGAGLGIAIWNVLARALILLCLPSLSSRRLTNVLARRVLNLMRVLNLRRVLNRRRVLNQEFDVNAFCIDVGANGG